MARRLNASVSLPLFGLTVLVLAGCSATSPASVPASSPSPVGVAATASAASTPALTTPSPLAEGGASCPADASSLEPTTLELTAEKFEFSTDELRATACRPTVIEFSHSDVGTVHNVAVYTEALGNGEQLFRGELARDGEVVRYEIPPLMPGTYHFICDPHWQAMGGEFVVEE